MLILGGRYMEIYLNFDAKIVNKPQTDVETR